MLDSLTDFVEWLVGPGRMLLAVAIGLLISWTSTQAIKMHFSLSRRSTTGLAFLLAAGFTYAAAPGWDELALAVAVAVGLAAPWAYKGLVAIGRARGWVWVDALSSTPSTKP